MRKLPKILCVAVLFCLATVTSAYAAVIFSHNDFEQTHYTTWVGQVVFSGAGITLTPDATQHKAFIENINTTLSGSKAYCYYSISPTYTSDTVEQTFELFLKQGSTSINIQLVYYPTNTYKLRLNVNDTAVGTASLASIPNEGIIGWDGAVAYLYSTSGSEIAQITAASVDGVLYHYGFVSYYESVKLNTYVLTDDLTTAQTQGLTESTADIVTGFIPLLIALAMIGVCLSFIKKL